jgi:hypothetical protein
MIFKIIFKTYKEEAQRDQVIQVKKNLPKN